MKLTIAVILSFLIGVGITYFLIDTEEDDQVLNEYPKTYELYEGDSLTDNDPLDTAPIFISYKLELLSNDSFFYSTNGHMAYDRVRGEIKKTEIGYDFVVQESYARDFYVRGDVLFSASNIDGPEIKIIWGKAIPLRKESNTFVLE